MTQVIVLATGGCLEAGKWCSQWDNNNQCIPDLGGYNIPLTLTPILRTLLLVISKYWRQLDFLINFMFFMALNFLKFLALSLPGIWPYLDLELDLNLVYSIDFSVSMYLCAGPWVCEWQPKNNYINNVCISDSVQLI